MNDTVEALNNIRKGSAKLDPVLISVTDKISTVKGIVDTVFSLTHNVDLCCQAISTLKKVASALSGIPIIGSVASVISKILEEAQVAANAIHMALGKLDKVLKKVDALLKKALGGMDELIKCNGMVHDHIPEFTKTIQIIDYVIQMAKIVEPIVIGEDMKKRLDDLLSHLEKIEATAAVPIDELNKFLDEIGLIISSVKDECDRIKEKTAGLANAIKNIGTAVSILNPIGVALNAVINAIAPIKWVLTAVACLIEKILKPVIDLILKATGLQKLIDMLSDKLMELLGINDVISIIEDWFSNQALLDKLAVVSDAFNNITSKWNNFAASLDDFSPVKAVDMKAKMKELLLTVFNGVTDPSKPAPIPDWPDEPDIIGDRMEKLAAHPRYDKIDWGYPALSDNYRIDLTVFRAITYRHKEAQALEELIGKASRGVNAIYPSLSQYQAKLVVLQRTPDLPSYFANEIELLGTYLKFIHDLVDFFAKLSDFPESKREQLKSIAQFIQGQIDDSLSIAENIPVLQENIDRIVRQQRQLTEQLPAEESLSEMLTRINTWPVSLDHMLDGYQLGVEQNPTPQQMERLTAVDKDLKADANALSGVVTDIAAAAQKIIESFDKLDKKIDSGIDVLKDFSPQGYILPEKYLDKMQQVAKTVHQLDAIFEPLLLLLEVLREKEDVPSQNSLLDFCKNRLTLFADRLDGEVKANNWLEFIEIILKQLSPISHILANLNAVNKDLTKILAALTTDAEILTGHIGQLITVMNTEKSYKFGNEEINNRFFTQEQAESACQLAKDIVQ